ncbi:MAG TPA: DUF5683 domain-containing protein [Bacteroidia bacterium]|nr:DUF5683 domain-containing protein [Bacteroidia bacterium]
MKFTKYHKLFFVAVFFLFVKSFAFNNSSIPVFTDDKDDSLKKVINKDARKASIMSAVLPGLGQIYNKKYWKVPVIYAALGGLGYFAMQKNQEYQNYHNELIYRYAHGDTLKNDPGFSKYTTDQVNTLKISAKKNRDFLFIGMGIVYLLNIIDANVSAHLKTFEVSDKLSLGIRPKAFYCRNSAYGVAGGITIALNFK